MDNIDVFNDYDMVVCLTQRSLNRQLAALASQGVIPNRLAVVAIEDDKGSIRFETRSQVRLGEEPEEPRQYAGLTGTFVPQVLLEGPGAEVILLLKFTSGEARFWGNSRRMPKLNRYDLKGWQCAIRSNLNLAELEAAYLAQGKQIPPHLAAQLRQFQANMFRVQHLFLDLKTTDLASFDSKRTTTNNPYDQIVNEVFRRFMLAYIGSVSKDRPFVLGYTVERTPRTPANTVPEKLRPTGTTFTVYADKNNPEQSTLNYVLATQGGHQRISGTPPAQTRNWLAAGDNCDGKMIVSSTCLMEEYVLKPLFAKLRDELYPKIREGLDPPIGSDYGAARKTTPTGLKFEISNVTGGNETDEYVNNFSVDFQNTSAGTAEVRFKGRIWVKKTKHTDCFFCTARSWVGSNLDWSGTVTLSAGAGGLAISSNIQSPTPSQSRWTNECADTMSVLGEILGWLPLMVTAIGGILIREFASVSIPSAGNLGNLFAGLQANIGTAVLLPGGSEFTLSRPACDSQGNLSVDLTCR